MFMIASQNDRSFFRDLIFAFNFRMKKQPENRRKYYSAELI